MNTSCKEAYSIFVQYNLIHNHISTKIQYIIDLIKKYKSKEQIIYYDLKLLVMYIKSSIGHEKVSDYQRFRIMNEITELNLPAYSGMDILLNSLIQSITTITT